MGSYSDKVQLIFISVLFLFLLKVLQTTKGLLPWQMKCWQCMLKKQTNKKKKTKKHHRSWSATPPDKVPQRGLPLFTQTVLTLWKNNSFKKQKVSTSSQYLKLWDIPKVKLRGINKINLGFWWSTRGTDRTKTGLSTILSFALVYVSECNNDWCNI